MKNNIYIYIYFFFLLLFLLLKNVFFINSFYEFLLFNKHYPSSIFLTINYLILTYKYDVFP